MAKAFISYARADEDAAKRLSRELERRGIEVLSMDRLVAPGEPWAPKLQSAIAESDLFLLLVSPESERSPWIATEAALAVSQAEQGRTRVIPVRLSRKGEIPALLQHIQGIDFFDSERSQQQLDNLVESLRIPRTGDLDRLRGDLNARIEYLRVSREALEKEMTVQASERAVWSSTIAAAVTALAAIATALAGLLSFSDAANEAVQRWGLPFGSCPGSGGKEKWRILPVGEVHDQHAACQGGHRRNAPWARVSRKMRGRRSLSPSRSAN